MRFQNDEYCNTYTVAKFSWKKGGKLYEFPKYLFWFCILQLFAFKHKPQTFSRVCLRFITWHLPFETRRLPFKVYCLKIIKTEPVYTCKKRLLTSSSLWYHLKTYTSFYFKKLVCFALKLIKLASKHDSYSSRTVGFRILIGIYIFASEWLPFQTANVML